MMSISAGMYEVTSRPTSCSRTAGFDQTFMTSSYFGKMPSKIGWPRRGPTHWSDDLFSGSLQSADPEHASPDRHGGYKPQAPDERKSKGLTNACAIRHLFDVRAGFIAGSRQRHAVANLMARTAGEDRCRGVVTRVTADTGRAADFGRGGAKPSRRAQKAWKIVLILPQGAVSNRKFYFDKL